MNLTENILTAIVNVTGASPADILVKDDPDDPQWYTFYLLLIVVNNDK